MAEIRWTEEAAKWLNDIYDYIALDNPTAAGRVVTGIYERVQLLQSSPALGHRYRADPEGDGVPGYNCEEQTGGVGGEGAAERVGNAGTQDDPEQDHRQQPAKDDHESGAVKNAVYAGTR